MIAGITQNPYSFDPVIFPEKNANRRIDVLDKMKELGYITEAEYNDPLMPGKYMTKLSIRCAWSELEEFIVGQTYTATK